MKTTVDILDTLLDEARQIAAREGTTVRALVEEGLRHVVESRRARPPFVLRRASFKGVGLHPDAQGGTWEQVRDAIYRGRGA